MDLFGSIMSAGIGGTLGGASDDFDDFEDFEDLFSSDESLDKIDKSKYQAEIIFNRFLPYKNELDDEASLLFAQIKANLGKCAMTRDINPGCEYWSDMLRSYIDLYGLKFTKDDHITLIKLMYQLIIIPNLQSSVLENFCYVLIALLKKKETISPQDLELDWEPLYELCYPEMFYKHKMRRQSVTVGLTLESLVEVSKVYFHPNATQQILDKLRPMMCPLDQSVIGSVFRMYRCFLPVELAPEHHKIGHELWFHEFMRFWEVCHNENMYVSDLMKLLAELASNNIGYIDWNPYIPVISTRLMRSLELPVHYKNSATFKFYFIEIMDVGQWIASVLGHNSSAQFFLNKFVKTIETYLHPANVGTWFDDLEELINQINFSVVKRIHRERHAKKSWRTSVPDSHKLTDADIDNFVNSMLPITMIGVVHNSALFYTTLRYLAIMRPNLVIPKVLDNFLPAISTDVEPQKAEVAMNCIIRICQTLVQGSNYVDKDHAFIEGPSYVTSILSSCLPNINVNDANKSLVSLKLISTLVSLIPIVDCSQSNVEKDENEQIVCEETSNFEDFVLQLMDKIFSLISSSSQEYTRLENSSNDSRSNFLELISESIISGMFKNLLFQSSAPIFTSALNKLRSFVETSNLEAKVAGKIVAKICAAFSSVNSQLTLKSLLPRLCERILEAMDECDDQHVNDQLLYPLLLLHDILIADGEELLNYMDLIIKVLDKVTASKNHEIHRSGCLSLTNVLASFTETYPHGVDRDLNDSEHAHWKDWGQIVNIKTAKLRWHLPSDRELAAAEDLFKRYFLPAVTSVENYIANSETLSRDELQTKLRIIYRTFTGCEFVLPMWSEAPLVSKPFDSCVYTFDPVTGVKHEIKMPDGSNVRAYIVKLMEKLIDVMLGNSEQDSKGLVIAVLVLGELSMSRSKRSEQLSMKHEAFYQAKRKFEDKVAGTNGYVPPLLGERVAIQHQTRKYSAVFPLTETTKIIIQSLFKLCISQYSAVRRTAQSILGNVSKDYPSGYQLLLPQVLEILGRDTETHHDAYKGTLYLICKGYSDSYITKEDWHHWNKLLPALVLAKPSEKPSIIRQFEGITNYIIRSVATINITLEVPDSCVSAASQLWEIGEKPSTPMPTENDVEKGIDDLKKWGANNLSSYYNALQKLLDAMVEHNLHWRHRQLAMNFIKMLIHPDHLVPAPVVRYFLHALLNESIEDRHLAIGVMNSVLIQMKRKHVKIEMKIENCNRKVKPGPREDNAWLQYTSENLPKTAADWDSPRFVHKQYIGYYAWPDKIEVYAPSSQQPLLNRSDDQLTEQEKEIDRFFSAEENIAKLFTFLSIEGKTEEHYSNHLRLECYDFFRCLFRNFGNKYLPNFLPLLRELAQDKQQHKQRCASEIVGGLIRGSKHWSFDMVEDLWKNLLPIIRSVLNNLTEETIIKWVMCFKLISSKIDPRRIHWLIECLIEEFESARSEVSLIESARLRILNTVLASQTWRMNELLNKLLVKFETRLLENPFNNVRNELAMVLVTIFKCNIDFSTEVERSEQGKSKLEEFIDKVYQILEPLSSIENTPESEERVKSLRLLNSMCTWIQNSTSSSHLSNIPSFYKLLPIIFKFENDDSDEELSLTCSQTLAVLGPAEILFDHIPLALNTIENVSTNPSWSLRSSCVQFLEVFLFHNMSLLLSSESLIARIRDLVLKLLQDERIEVREQSAQVISGMLHCSLITDRQSLLDYFRTLAKTKLPKKRDETFNKALCSRHAGILGMCTFIQAHPYDIPTDVPPILEYLSDHLNDPEPVPETIRKTLNEFKRTHCDAWTGLEGLAQDLSEEQFALLQDLTVPPSHYA